jgi:hypothetical protein
MAQPEQFEQLERPAQILGSSFALARAARKLFRTGCRPVPLLTPNLAVKEQSTQQHEPLHRPQAPKDDQLTPAGKNPRVILTVRRAFLIEAQLAGEPGPSNASGDRDWLKTIRRRRSEPNQSVENRA